MNLTDVSRADMEPPRRFSVLMLSTANSVRSILAEHLLRQSTGGRLEILSAGMHPNRRVDPDVIRVLSERYGIQGVSQQCRSWEGLRDHPFGLVITLSLRAKQLAAQALPAAVKKVHWESPHPTDLAVTPEGHLQAVVDIASQIAARARLLAQQPDDRLAHAAWQAGQAFPFPVSEFEPLTCADDRGHLALALT